MYPHVYSHGVCNNDNKEKITIVALFFEPRFQIAEEVEAPSNGTISPRMCPFLR
jgi:hypothetical protein